MRLSTLQKYILETTYYKGGSVDREAFLGYYLVERQNRHQPSLNVQTNIITRSLLRLIEKELLVGFGRRTSQKWFIEFVQLTPKGKKNTKHLFGYQQELPLNEKKSATKKFSGPA